MKIKRSRHEQQKDADSVDRDAAAWLAELPYVDPQLEAVRMRLLRIGRHLDRMLIGIAARHGMTLGDWETLSVLKRDAPGNTLAPSELANALRVTSGTMSVRLDRLVKAGLVEQGSSTVDGRSRPIRLTPAGEQRWRAATDERTALEREILSSVLNSARIGQLNRLLRPLLHAFESRHGPSYRLARDDGDGTAG